MANVEAAVPRDLGLSAPAINGKYLVHVPYPSWHYECRIRTFWLPGKRLASRRTP
jgi:hypothetical protein